MFLYAVYRNSDKDKTELMATRIGWQAADELRKLLAEADPKGNYWIEAA